MLHIFIIYLFICWWLWGWAHFLAIVTRPVGSMVAQVYLWSYMKPIGVSHGGVQLLYGTFSSSFKETTTVISIPSVSVYTATSSEQGFFLCFAYVFIAFAKLFLYDSSSSWGKMELQVSLSFPDGQRYWTLYKHLLGICVSSFESYVYFTGPLPDRQFNVMTMDFHNSYCGNG